MLADIPIRAGREPLPRFIRGWFLLYGRGRNWLRKFIQDESGQMLPFVAVAMLIIIGWAAIQLGLSSVYLEKTRLRDAADAAALAVIENAEVKYVPTYYGERWVRPKKDKNGNV